VGRVRVSRVIRARVAYAVGVVLVAVGVFLAVSLGWALVVAGLGVAVAAVWLYDVSEPVDAVITRQEEDW
jgi:4-hydroxybenzoate polyprenyltransferase